VPRTGANEHDSAEMIPLVDASSPFAASREDRIADRSEFKVTGPKTRSVTVPHPKTGASNRRLPDGMPSTVAGWVPRVG